MQKQTAYSIEDYEVLEILGRTERLPDYSAISDFYRGSRVCITGGAGSIGGELVRILHDLKVEIEITAIDFHEYGIYQLRRNYPGVRSILMDAGDPSFEDFNFDYIFHACAYKQVPLSEDSEKTFEDNNIGSFINVLSHRNDAKLLLVSTDKAVEPVCAMGRTKQVCEKIAGVYGCSAVRFGNVINSAGSVIPLWMEQLSDGKNLTLTDEKMKRYFMSRLEACGLLLEAMTLERGLYTLDMGEQYYLKDLAEGLILESGLEVGVDVIGMRAGERLEEVLSVKGLRESKIKGIYYEVADKGR